MELGQRVAFEVELLPALATVVAAPELTVREPGDDASLVRDECVRHRRQWVGQSACERAPLAVAAAVNERLRIAPAVRRIRAGAG